MSPEVHRSPVPESGKDEKDKDGKPAKKSYRFLPNESVTPTKGDNGSETAQRPVSLDEIIAASQRRRAEAAAAAHSSTVEAAEPPKRGFDEAQQPTHEQSDAPADTYDSQTTELQQLTAPESQAPHEEQAPDDTDMQEAYDEAQLPHWRDLRPNEFSGGETVHIRDVDAVEGEVPLHTNESPDLEPPAQTDDTREYPVFIPQQEQQHQATDVLERASAEHTLPTAGGGGGDKPPVGPREATPLPGDPERPINTPIGEVIDREQHTAATETNGTTSAVRPSPERPATKQEVEDAMYYSARANAQHGIISGLFLGTYFANRRIKRKQKQETKLLNTQAKQLERQQEQINTLQQNQVRSSATTERQFTAVDTRFDRLPQPEQASARIEQKQKLPTPNQHVPAEQPLQVPEGHHLETSAWHTIEVDNKTGKPVEHPTFEYGREYQREHAHEHMPLDQQPIPSNNNDSASDQSGSHAATQSGDQNKPVPDATVQGMSTSRSSKVKEALQGQSASGPIWPWIPALVVAVICLVLVLR